MTVSINYQFIANDNQDCNHKKHNTIVRSFLTSSDIKTISYWTDIMWSVYYTYGNILNNLSFLHTIWQSTIGKIMTTSM